MLEHAEHSFEDGLTKTLSVTSLDMMLSLSEGSRYNVPLFGAYLSTTSIFRGRNNAPLTQTCTAGVFARSCKLRRAPRPRKLDETLSRRGRSARRVALLSPRATFSLYCSPLDYLYARLKLFQEEESKSRILGGVNSSRVGEESRRGGGGTILP